MTAASPLADTPRFQPIEPDNLPALLRDQPRWLCWKAGPPKPEGKFDKVPVDPHSGRNINGRKEAKWRTFADVIDAYRRGAADGVGFALSDHHPIVVDGTDFYVTVADFDHCRARMDEIFALWRDLGQPFTEVSPSLHGLHMWGLSRLALKGGNAGGGRELYTGSRFVTMTGISARGRFGECPGFAALERQWFPPKPLLAAVPLTPPVIASAALTTNFELGPPGDHWFDRLSPDDKNACLSELLQLPAVIALADTLDDAPSPNWRTILAACVRSVAPKAYELCLAWAQTSQRFGPDDFASRWGSYAGG